jgi:hypothetical protein
MSHDWKALVSRHAQSTGAGHLPPATIDELAAHLEDLYTESRASGRSDAEAYRSAEAALIESGAGLRAVPRPRTRGLDSRPHTEVPAGSGITGIAGDLRFAWRQWRRSPSFAAIAILTLGLGLAASATYLDGEAPG